MGNNPSTPPKHAGQSQSLSQVPSAGERSQNERDPIQQPRFNRRQSAHTIPTQIPKATAAPPSASLESAVGQSASTASTSSSPSQPRSISKSSTQSRNRSATDSIPTLSKAQDTPDAIMGNDNSKQQREPSQSRSARSTERPAPIKASVSPATQALDMPGTQEVPSHDPSFTPHALPPNSFSRPPRLPMAIEEEDVTPGSPIMSPTGGHEIDPIDREQVEEQEEGRRGSVISSNVDDEEEPDEFQGYMPSSDANTVKVPTIVEYKNASPHDRIYVTGTFTDWQRKFRLHWNGPSKKEKTVSAILQLPPGTHHVKFLVNNEMVCSDFLPQAVDFTNILVNYIEVSAEDATSGTKGAPVAVPTSEPASAVAPAPASTQAPAATTAPVPTQAPVPARPVDIRPKPASTSAATSSAPPSSPPTKTQMPASQSPAPARASPKPIQTQAVQQESKPAPSPTSTKPRIPVPPKQYTSQIPEYLIDIDSWPSSESSQSPDPSSATSRYQRASQAAQTLPPPPSLPLFLNKSILNGATPMKDDSSVLPLPNHTVLNHLATTNIKQGVLATSGTTRYKKKFLTTIMYKPRSEDGD